MNDRVVWRVKRIQEADYGCEERLDGEKLKVLVTLEDDQGGQRQLLVEDDRLYENGIDEGSEWPADDSECLERAESVEDATARVASYV